MRATLALFSRDDRSQGTRDALAKVAEARHVDTDPERDLLIAALLPHFPKNKDTFDEVLAVLDTIEPRYRDAALTALATHAAAEHLNDVLDFARASCPKAEFFRQAAPRLTADQLPVALQLCQRRSDRRERAEAFAALTPRMDADEVRRFLAPCQGGIRDRFLGWPVATEFLDLAGEEPRLLVTRALLDQLPPQEARAIAQERIIPRLAPYYGELDLTEDARNFAWFARYLPEDLRRRALAVICKGMSWDKQNAEKNAPFLQQFAPFSDDEVAEAFHIAETAHPISWWPGSSLMVADVLAPHLTSDQLRYARDRVTAFPLEEECFAAIAQLGLLQAGATRDETARRGLALAESINHPRYKTRAVAALAPILVRPDLAAKAFEIIRSVKEPLWMASAMDAMADVLPAALLRAVPDAIGSPWYSHPALDIPRTLKRLSSEGYTTAIDSLLPPPECSWKPHGWEKTLSRLAPLLSPSQARRLWETWDREDSWPDDAEALSALVGRLPGHERAVAVDEVLAIYAPGSGPDYRSEARTLGRLARAAPTERLTQVIRELLHRRPAVKDWVLEELAPAIPETLIEEALRYALSDDDDLACRSLAELAPRLSGALLNRAIAHVSKMKHHQWKAAALPALARQLPHDRAGRETVLALAVEAAARWPSYSMLEGALPDLIPQLPERLRHQAVSAATGQVCWDLRWHEQLSGRGFDRLHAVVMVLRGPELKQLYARLGEEVEVPRVRARAQAAVIQQAGGQHAPGFLAGGQPLHHDWPGDLDRAGLMDLIAAAAWWIDSNSHGTDIDEVVEAIFDVARWWP